MSVTYVTEAIVAGLLWGPPVGFAVLIVGPVTGYVALRFGERLVLRHQALRAYWLRVRQASIAREIDARRRELAEMVEAELGRCAPARPPC